MAQWVLEAGLKVDHFAEEEILTRPQFTEVAAYFRATGGVEPAMLLAAASRFASAALAEDVDVVAADALVPFVPSLLAAGCDDEEIEQFVAALTRQLAPVEPLLLFLDGDPAVALARAAARKSSHWLEWYTRKLARHGLTQNLATWLPLSHTWNASEQRH